MEAVLQTYWWILFIFVVFKCIFDYNHPTLFQHRYIILMLFSVVFFIFLFSYNVTYTKQPYVCGTQNVSLAFYATIFPYIFIYMLGIMIITVFPGWLRSFSNTFGLTIIRFCGYEKTIAEFQKLLKPDKEPNLSAMNQSPGVSESKQGEEVQQNQTIDAINNIFNDPSVFINELEYPEIKDNDLDIVNWNHFNNVMKNITVNETATLDKDKKDVATDIVRYMSIKDTISTYIWVGLLSTITILVGQNRLIGETCNAPVVNDDKFQKYIATQLKSD